MKRIAALVAVLALTTAAWSTLAQAQSGFKVTGGGQIMNEDQTQGAGDTIAFTAIQEDGTDSATGAPAAKGQVQFVDRTGTGGRGDVMHGEVTCLRAVTTPAGTEGAAVLGGYFRNGTGKDAAAGTPFEIYVQDNGEGEDNSDLITFNQDDNFDCAEDSGSREPRLELARGNAQVHNYTAP